MGLAKQDLEMVQAVLHCVVVEVADLVGWVSWDWMTRERFDVRAVLWEWLGDTSAVTSISGPETVPQSRSPFASLARAELCIRVDEAAFD